MLKCVKMCCWLWSKIENGGNIVKGIVIVGVGCWFVGLYDVRGFGYL